MEAAGEAVGSKDALLDRRLKMMIGFGDSETQQREQALENAILRAVQGGMPSGNGVELRRLVLGHYKETFCRELKGQLPVQREPMWVVWTPTAWTTKAKPRLYTPEKRAWLSEQIKLLEHAQMMYLNPQMTFTRVAMALQKGDTSRTVVGYQAANDQVEKVPWPHPRSEKVQGFFEGTT